VLFREGFSVVLVVDAENLCQSLILATIKKYSLYASVVKLVIILPAGVSHEFHYVLGGSCYDRLFLIGQLASRDQDHAKLKLLV
jgi:cobyrinic acid a,c-diamide synthase